MNQRIKKNKWRKKMQTKWTTETAHWWHVEAVFLCFYRDLPMKVQLIFIYISNCIYIHFELRMKCTAEKEKGTTKNDAHWKLIWIMRVSDAGEKKRKQRAATVLDRRMTGLREQVKSLPHFSSFDWEKRYCENKRVSRTHIGSFLMHAVWLTQF